MLWMIFYSVLFGAVISLLILWIGYLLLLTVCAWFAPRSTTLPADPKNRFVVLIPAHNEEKLLPDLLDSLAQMAYPPDLYQIHVVADNCTDRTAQVATSGGARVHVRVDAEKVGKGYALQWLFEELLRDKDEFDAAVMLDADSVVSTNFLCVMDAKLQQGSSAVQAYYAVRDADRSWAVSLRAAALAVLHYLRPQGRTVLGLSVGLKGNGMAFTRALLTQHQWSASITEDIAFHMSLILAGERVVFAPDAVVWAEIPTTLSDSSTQNARWEQGRLETARAYIPTLLKRSLLPNPKSESLSRGILFDSAMEHMIPPFSIVIGVNLIALLLALAAYFLTGRFIGLVATSTLLLAQIFYLLSGMVLTQTPLKVYRSILYVPLFLCWKILIYVRVLLKPNQREWIRTKRVGEQL